MAFAAWLVGFVALAGCRDGGDETVADHPTSLPNSVATSGSTTTPPSTVPGTTAVSVPPPSSVAATTAPTSTGPTGPPPPGEFSVVYPEGWGASGQVLATAFATGATCRSALIVDRAPPGGSGPGASIEQSFVQICWRGLENKALSEFIAATYGSAVAFEPTTLAGRPAVVTRGSLSSTYFVDTSTRRYQVSTAVAASDELRATRVAQVDRILASLSLPG